MDVLFSVYAIIIGLICGSFFNVVGLRVPVGHSIISPRSRCPHCDYKLTASDLIPIVSYFWLKGRCRQCKERVSPLYPIVEGTTGVLFMFAWLTLGWTFELLVAALFLSLLMIIFVSDMRYMLIPDVLLLSFGVPLLLLRLTVASLESWWDPLVGGVVGFLLLLLIAIISKGGMGGGDIKLFAVLGIVFGWPHVLLVFFFSILFGAICGGIGMLIGKVKRGVPIPFGPFIVAASILVYFAGEEIWRWYFHEMLLHHDMVTLE